MGESEYEIDIIVINRKRMVLDYIVNNHGCSNRDIVRGLSFNKNVVSVIIQELINDGIIQNKKGKKNLNVLVPVDNNEVSFVEQTLLNFKQSYVALLDGILNHSLVRRVIDSINFDIPVEELSEIAQTANILKIQYSKFNRSKDLYSKIRLHMDRINTVLETPRNESMKADSFKEKNQPRSVISSDTNSTTNNFNPKMSQSQMKNVEERSRLNIKEIDIITKLKIQYSHCLQRCAYIVLTSWPIILYLFLSLHLSYRSLFVWPEKIKDKKIFFELTEFTNRNLQDIREISIDFLSKCKNKRMKSEFDFLKDEVCLTEKKVVYSKVYHDFSFMGLRPLAINVLDSLNRLENNDSKYDFEDIYLESVYHESKSILNRK